MRLTLSLLVPALVFSLFLAAPQASAMQAKRGTQITHEEGALPLTVRVEGAYLWGKSFERVYLPNGGQKISELIWTLENVYMVGAVVSAEPLPWLQINLGGWMPVNQGDNTMDDYDWLAEDVGEWTDWSHSKADLKRALLLDGNVQARFLEYKGFGAWLMGGFKYANWFWSDEGKFYIYSENDFRDSEGSFNNENGIDYEQWFYTPYAGLSLTYDWDALHLTGYVNYSPIAWAKDEDHHFMRNLLFKGEFEKIDYMGIGIQAVWDVTQNFYAGAAFDFQQYLNKRGDVTISTGEYEVDGGGIEHFSHMVSLTLGWRF